MSVFIDVLGLYKSGFALGVVAIGYSAYSLIKVRELSAFLDGTETICLSTGQAIRDSPTFRLLQ